MRNQHRSGATTPFAGRRRPSPSVSTRSVVDAHSAA